MLAGIRAGALLRFALLACAATAAAYLRPVASSMRPDVAEVIAGSPLFPPEVARPFSFGLHSLLADVSFLQAIQTHGGRKSNVTAAQDTPQDRALVRLLDYTTELDPQFCGAYRYAGSAIPRHSTDGKAVGVMATEQLMQRGVKDCPDDWKVAFLLGFLETFYLGRTDKAAEAMALASKHPDAPKYVAFLATRLAADAGAVDMGEKLAMAMEAEATEDGTRQAWHDRRLDLLMERHLREIEAAAKRFKDREGHEAPSIDVLVKSRDLPSIPEEPHGGTFQLLPDGEARSSAAPRLRVRGRTGTQSGLLAQ